MNMSLIIMEGKCGAIDADDYSCHGYYIIKFYSSSYIFQSDLNIYGQVMSSGEMICEVTYFFPIDMTNHHYSWQKINQITFFFLKTIINGNINIIFYYLKDVLSPCSRSMSQNYYNTFSPLNISTKEHDIILDEKNQRERIELEISVSIGTQDTTYYFNGEFWDSI